jgi:hypothetical protein
VWKFVKREYCYVLVFVSCFISGVAVFEKLVQDVFTKTRTMNVRDGGNTYLYLCPDVTDYKLHNFIVIMCIMILVTLFVCLNYILLAVENEECKYSNG